VTRLVVAPRAQAQIAKIGTWWRANREKAPELFSRELADALEAMLEMPSGGQPYRPVRGVAVRRLLLSGCNYHVYFSYDGALDVVQIRAVWHAARGQGPLL
jgi:plasmid stabilization system protein ParE